MHKTAAKPLSVVYALLIVYASLFPFSDWRDQGIAPFAFLFAPLPQYWTAFDAWINVLGYFPFGALLAWGALRVGRGAPGVVLACVLASALSLGMEALQVFLPGRVPSREDWLLNSSGAVLGAFVALALQRIGLVERWGQLRMRWFSPRSRGALVLIALWPAALLFPPAVPFGTGQVLERLMDELASQWQGTPLVEWVSLRPVALHPLTPGGEWLCIVLGMLLPCLLGFMVTQPLKRRLVFVLGVFVAGLGTSTLSAALSWGPGHMFAWADPLCQFALASALLVAWALALVPARVCAPVLLLMLGVYLALLNQAPQSPYYAQTLQEWEQGKFIRFNGLAQWFGWLWPYASLLYVVSTVAGDVERHRKAQ